ncbi:AGAP010853-PA [Anopheles gambiae str. PEST]|uniref:AGAP010853-PA n=1 Tax=Anopheles gambiae TaxID=7165 RepID=A7US78_ANOGA|nr:AGAP010853-PA [Anopheles gambiae str. PEST]
MQLARRPSSRTSLVAAPCSRPCPRWPSSTWACDAVQFHHSERASERHTQGLDSN